MSKRTIAGAELFAVGQWNGLAFTAQDIDSIVNSFLALSLEGRVPLKLSHEGDDARDTPESKYALGWVKKVWRDGDVLKGDLEVPEKVASAIADGYLKFVSVELLKNVKADTRTIPWVLDAVALLGADQPAVGILRDLQALMTRRSVAGQFQCESRAAFRRDDHKSEDTRMTLEEEIAALKAANARLEREKSDEAAEFARKETLRIESTSKAAQAEARDMFKKAVDKELIVPAVGERFLKFQAPREDDHARWAEFDLKTIEQVIEENPKPEGKMFGRKKAASGDNQEPNMDEHDTKALEGKDPSQKVMHFARKNLSTMGAKATDQASFDEAVKAALRAQPELADEYKFKAEHEARASK